MIDDHERIEELLTGYALLSLDGEDAAEADRLLAEHVPTCLACRRTIEDLRIVTGDLALLPAPVPVPDLLLPQIHRAIDAVPRRGRSRSGAAWIAAAASVVALVAMGGVSLTMADRASDAETRHRQAVQAAVLAARNGAVSVDPVGPGAGTTFFEVRGPDVRTLYLTSTGCPQPTAGMVYEVWLGRDGEFVPFGRFVPEDGYVFLNIPVDVSRFNEIAITQEPEGSNTAEPNLDGPRVWRATLET